MTHPVVAQDVAEIAARLGARARKLSGKTVLIAGGAGFLGSYIVAVLERLNRTVLSKPCKVVVLDNYITGSKKNVLGEIRDPNIKFVTHDVTKPFKMTGPLDYVLHAAGIASPVYYRKYPVEAIESAIWGAKGLLELAKAKKVKSFLFFSSSEIYGDPDPKFIPTPETYKGNVSCIGPRSCYDESKRLGETMCMTYHQRYRVPIKVVRPFNVYGPGMKPNDYRVVPTFFLRALRGEPLPVHNKGLQTRTFCYVTDAVTGFMLVLLSDKSGEVYNVGNDQGEISMAALAETVAELFDDAKIDHIEYPKTYPKDEPQRRMPDLTKIRRGLGFQPRVDLRTGLARTLEVFKTAVARPRR
jgi:UDP-glucuronate decarboxylase